MNKKLSLAVAGAVLAFGASAANAGIVIPAGDWTVDIGGNVNTYYTNTNFSGSGAAGQGNKNQISTGLLPSAIGIGGKTRQNDLDIAFQFTFFTGVNAGNIGGSPLASSTNSSQGQSTAGGGNSINVRQAYLTFGDASWGTIKAGRDLGVFGSDAILSDMTLLGVGSGAGGQGNSTLGRIGSGYVYADWVGQIAYTSPNWNGFSFSVAGREPWSNGVETVNQKTQLGFDGKVAYEWTGDYAGKVWLGAISQKHQAGTFGAYTSNGVEVGGKINLAGFGLVGYYYDGKGLDTQFGSFGAGSALGGLQFLSGQKSDDNGGYVQGTYVIPNIGTKLGLSWGESKTQGEQNTYDRTNKSWIVGAYHPITKSLNLVAEYTDSKFSDSLAPVDDFKARTISLGAILFF